MSSPQAPPPDPQAAQQALAVLAALAVMKLWPSLDLLHLKRSLPAFKAAVAQEVRRHAQASATLAARQYRQQRVAAGAGRGFTPVPADPPSVAQVANSVDFALQPLWDTAVALQALDAAPAETRQVASSAIADAKARLAAASERHVLGAGWSTITDSVLADRKATAYARIPEPGCCSFCSMLAARGAVYKADSFATTSAKKKINRQFPEADRAHDNCRCHLEPVFGRYEPSARIRDWQGMYARVADEIGYGRDGKVTGADMRRAYRQAFEGRPIDLSKPSPAPGGGQKTTSAPGPTGRTQEQIQAELGALEKNLPRLTTDQQREWTSKRMDALRAQLDQQ